MRFMMWVLAFALVVLSGSALAQRAPCSGSRGGVVSCDGGRFVCADGAVSKSKKICQASEYVTADVVAHAPEKSSYTLIAWIVGVLAMLVVLFVWGVWALVRWVLREYNKKAPAQG